MNRFVRFSLVALGLLVASSLFVSCDLFAPQATPGKPGKLSVLSATTSGTSARSLFERALTALTNTSTATEGYIVSGAPDYLDATLTKISLKGSFADGQSGKVVWQGTKVLRLDGTTAIDTTGMDLSYPVGTVTSIELTFATAAKIKGSLTTKLGTGIGTTTSSTMTLVTKSSLSYDAVAHTGGASAYADFVGTTAEETAVSLSGQGPDFLVASEANLTLAAGDSPILTILVDLSRMLRFYDGLNTSSSNGGVNPGDPSNKAYFFSHSVFGQSVAVFFGAPGSIQGYQTLFVAYNSTDQLPPVTGSSSVKGTVPGWMTLVFAADGSIISGILSGDDDNAFTIAKGRVGKNSPVNGAFSFDYSLSADNYKLADFVAKSTLGDKGYATFKTPDRTDVSVTHYYFGEVEYTLKFKN